MTHPFGKVWDQPKLQDMLYDPMEDVVIMTKETWDRCHTDYSASNPTALYEGKAWLAKSSSQIRWVELADKPGWVNIISKRVVIH